jgi:hypothetical protein
MLDLIFGISVFGLLMFSGVLDLVFVGLTVGFFLIALAYLAGCESLRKGAKEE